ncbi:MAG: phosphatidate cytidylyltransferase [Clostridium sp.]|nr:phosphatidate cytidylyltransferase [Clostridium sp.]MCM1444334.1 phosphatidate cytidylyltransferase [Candidatus Amulumruptor caecigallinarius]
MRSRVISAIIMLLIFIPVLLVGGQIFNFLCLVLSICSLYEFIKVKQTKKELPNFIKFISYILISLIILLNSGKEILEFSIDYRLFCGIFIMYLTPVVLYHDQKIYSINDAFYMISGIIFLGISFSLLATVRVQNILLLVYLLLIAIITDTYAYITGFLIGKHKMIEQISPKKTIEGMIGGTLMGVFVSVLFYHNFIDNEVEIYIITIVSLFLSILGQFGDLCFSAIKRYFNVKDFSNLIPGHGGILDRLDSIIFIVLGFMFFISII